MNVKKIKSLYCKKKSNNLVIPPSVGELGPTFSE